MEHRHGMRFAIDLAVLIDARPHIGGLARVENVSLSGMLVRTSLELPRPTPVQVRFLPPRDGATVPLQRVEALITRQGHGVLALEWSDPAAPEVAMLLGFARALPVILPQGERQWA